MMPHPLVAIGEVVDSIETWNPESQGPDATFTYIDLSSVDQTEKQITGERLIQCGEAPSRARQIVRTGDVLVSTVRPNLNAVAFVPVDLDRATASTGFSVLRPRGDRVAGRYLFHWVKSSHFVDEMVRRATGASYPAVSDRIIAESKLPLPPLSEQRRIAEILDKADALRAKRRTALAQLDTLTQSIFLDMFGDPATNPKGWVSATLGDLILSASDGPHVSPKYVTDGIPFLSTRHVRAGEISWNDLKFISQDEADKHWRKCKPIPGDIIYSKGGTTGLAAVVTANSPFAVWVHLAVLKPNPERVDSSWLEAMLNSAYCYRQSQELTHGIANRDLGLTRMVMIKMYHPALSEQRRFAREAAAVTSLREQHGRSAKQFDAFFASLQHRAFSGEL